MHTCTHADDDLEDSSRRPISLGMVFLKSLDGKAGRVVKRIKQGSAADIAGVRPGDRCLSINGLALETASDEDLARANIGEDGSTAIVVLRNKKGEDTVLTLTRRRFDSGGHTLDSVGSERSFDASVYKGSSGSGLCGIGLTFDSWHGKEKGLRVKRVKAGGPADLCGKIEKGDLVLQIDGNTLAGIDHRSLVDLIMGPDGSVCVVEFTKASGKAETAMLTRGASVQEKPQVRAFVCVCVCV
jgi:C-terminal processing protease CtpA/Prc